MNNHFLGLLGYAERQIEAEIDELNRKGTRPAHNAYKQTKIRHKWYGWVLRVHSNGTSDDIRKLVSGGAPQ